MNSDHQSSCLFMTVQPLTVALCTCPHIHTPTHTPTPHPHPHTLAYAHSLVSDHVCYCSVHMRIPKYTLLSFYSVRKQCLTTRKEYVEEFRQYSVSIYLSNDHSLLRSSWQVCIWVGACREGTQGCMQLGHSEAFFPSFELALMPLSLQG